MPSSLIQVSFLSSENRGITEGENARKKLPSAIDVLEAREETG